MNKSKEAIFLQFVQQNRVHMNQFDKTKLEAVASFLVRASSFAQSLGLQDEFPLEEFAPVPLHNLEPDRLKADLFLVDQYLQQLEAETWRETHPQLSGMIVQIDEDWRTRIHTLISHIRDEVRKAEIDEIFRTSLLDKLNRFGTEVDRGQIALFNLADIVFTICEAGSERLRPALTLIEGKLIAPLTKLAKALNPKDDQRRLPKPEELGLTDQSGQNND